jgi:rubrerythrin
MILNTCSAVISLSKQMETETAKFYENIAEKNIEKKELLIAIAKENMKFIGQIESAYYGVITDAIEGCFAFELDTDKHKIDTGTSSITGLTEAMNKAIEIEEKMILFYTDAAEQSRTLMADVPRAFTMVAKKRGNRIQTLKSLLEK